MATTQIRPSTTSRSLSRPEVQALALMWYSTVSLAHTILGEDAR